jgi:hypothetical protein
MGKALVTNTPMGKIVSGLISDGVKLGVSTRALGSLKPLKDGINEVQDDLRLLAIDVVADPSAPDAFVAGLFEGRSYIWDNTSSVWVEQTLDRTKKELKTMSVKDIENNKIRLFEQFLQSLSANKHK